MASPAVPRDSSTIDFGRAFGFAFKDPDWIKKIVIGGAFVLLTVLIVGGFFVAGYWVRLLRRVVAGEERPLPEWDDLGGIFGDGVKLVGAYLVYLFGLVVAVMTLGCVAGLVGLGFGGFPRDSDGASAVLGVMGGLGLAAAYVLFALAGLVLAVFLPAVFVRVALLDKFEEAFAFRAHLRFIQANLGNYALSLVFYLVAHFLSQFGALLCCVGVFPAIFWGYLVSAYSLGETVRRNPASV
jgi:Protein of unknown function (DUF4013)